MTTKKQQPIVDGYPLDELWSALHKTIRRGEEEAALYWAEILVNFNPTGLWNYLTVITCEDVGLGSPIMPILIETFRQQYFREIEKLDPKVHRLILTYAVASLCRCPKSRLVHDLAWVVYGEKEHEGKRLEIPPYAIDHHTQRGRQLNRWNVWETEGCKLANIAKIPNPYTERANKLWKKYRKLSDPSQKPKKQNKGKKKDPSTNLDSYFQ